jgi:hypothetical protein
MGWTFVYLMLILEIPIVALFLIVRWAIRATPEEGEPVRADDNGGSKMRPRHPRHPRHPRDPLPRHPRRGPHGDPLPLPPPRSRTVVARARRSDRA